MKPKTVIYIQRKGQGYTETVDECYNWREARESLREHRFADPEATYYSSQRACKEWAKHDTHTEERTA
jgi:hypothetical protein